MTQQIKITEEKALKSETDGYDQPSKSIAIVCVCVCVCKNQTMVDYIMVAKKKPLTVYWTSHESRRSANHSKSIKS